jgi:hypothetical protein
MQLDVSLQVLDARLARRSFTGDPGIARTDGDEASISLINDDAEFFGVGHGFGQETGGSLMADQTGGIQRKFMSPSLRGAAGHH